MISYDIVCLYPLENLGETDSLQHLAHHHITEGVHNSMRCMRFTFSYGLGESRHKDFKCFVVHEVLYVDYRDGGILEVATTIKVISYTLCIICRDTGGCDGEPWERLFAPL